MKICDAHNDFLTSIENKQDREKYIKSICKYVEILGCAVFTTNKNITIKDIKNYKRELEYLSKKYNIKLLLTIEDIGFIKTEKELKELINLKPFSVTLTWNENNQFAGGAHSKSGLTKLGKHAIKLLEQNNVLVDTAHLNKNSFWQFIKITTKLIFNSHSNLYSLKKHKRNLTKKQINKIRKTNGYIGLTLYSKFIGGKESNHVLNQFEYLKNNFNLNNFGFGTDFYGVEKIDLPNNIKTYKDLTEFTNILKQNGYTKKEIKNIYNQNFKNFFYLNNFK